MSLSISGSQITFNDASTQTTAATGFGFKNRIINGAMMIDQRNAGASVTPASAGYTLDRWRAGMDVGSKYSVQQTPSATETGYSTRVGAGFSSYLAITSTSSYTVGTNEQFTLQQRIEGLNTYDLAWGTANAKTVTLSFLAYSSLTGTFSGSVRNSASNRSYPFSYTISSANTWTNVSITIPGDTSGTWLTTNGIGITITFCLGGNGTVLGTANTWAGSDYVGVTGTTNVVSTNGATFYITGVQLEKGSTATSFDYRPYGTELQLCQRYFQKSFNIEIAPVNGTATTFGSAYGLFSQAASNNSFQGHISFPVSMRASPTVTTYGNSSGYWAYVTQAATSTYVWSAALSAGDAGTQGFNVNNGAVAALVGVSGHYTASAEL